MLFYCDHCDHVRFIVSFYRMTKYSTNLMLFPWLFHFVGSRLIVRRLRRCRTRAGADEAEEAGADRPRFLLLARGAVQRLREADARNEARDREHRCREA